jgi:hypothetical protein
MSMLNLESKPMIFLDISENVLVKRPPAAKMAQIRAV